MKYNNWPVPDYKLTSPVFLLNRWNVSIDQYRIKNWPVPCSSSKRHPAFVMTQLSRQIFILPIEICKGSMVWLFNLVFWVIRSSYTNFLSTTSWASVLRVLRIPIFLVPQGFSFILDGILWIYCLSSSWPRPRIVVPVLFSLCLSWDQLFLRHLSRGTSRRRFILDSSKAFPS